MLLTPITFLQSPRVGGYSCFMGALFEAGLSTSYLGCVLYLFIALVRVVKIVHLEDGPLVRRL